MRNSRAAESGVSQRQRAWGKHDQNVATLSLLPKVGARGDPKAQPGATGISGAHKGPEPSPSLGTGGAGSAQREVGLTHHLVLASWDRQHP